MKEQSMQFLKDKLTVTINKEGFTFWVNGFIVLDTPLERLKNDKEIAYKTLEILHQLMFDKEEE